MLGRLLSGSVFSISIQGYRDRWNGARFRVLRIDTYKAPHIATPLHCLLAKSNNRTRGQFECYVIWFCFSFDFVRSYAQCDCCSIVFWKGGWRVAPLKLDAQVQRSWKISDVVGQGVRYLHNFRGRHMCIVPNWISLFLMRNFVQQTNVL